MLSVSWINLTTNKSYMWHYADSHICNWIRENVHSSYTQIFIYLEIQFVLIYINIQYNKHAHLNVQPTIKILW